MIQPKDMLLTNHNRPGKKIIKLKGIVIHWTANTNKGANALANRNYFNTTDRAASAHYIVDDKTIIRCIPDDEIAYHVGATNYTAIGESIRVNPYSPNYYLIGIEMCVNSDGDWDKTYKNTIELVAALLKKYNLKIDDVYRHYDITGKDCPRMMIDSSAWLTFKRRVLVGMQEKISWIEIINKVASNPLEWEKAIKTAVNIASAEGSLGDLEILKYLPELIEKIYKGS